MTALPTASTTPFALKSARISAIVPDGRAQCVCIAVAHPSKLYITRSGIVTHNTTVTEQTPEQRQFAETEKALGGKPAYEKAKAAGKTKLNYGQWVQVRTPAFKAWFGDWEAGQKATMERRAKTLESAVEKAKAFVNTPLTNKATGLVAKVSNGNLGKMSSESASRKSTSHADHSLAIANADKLFANAVLDHSHADARGEPTIAAIHRYMAPMINADGQTVLVKMTVKETTGKNEPNPLYSIEAMEIENPPSALSRANPNGVGIRPQAGLSANVQELLAAVNTGASEITDPDTGEPMVVYHGTAQDFDAFDNAKTGANDRGLWGRGHYFASATTSANSYALRQGDGARLIPAYVSIQNPLILRTGRDLVTRLPDGTNTRDLIGQNLDGSKIKAIALDGGHDGVIQIIPDGSIGDVVAYQPTQIKSATGNSGAFDGGNPDIRYSRQAAQTPEQRQFAETEKALGGKPAYEKAKAAGKTKLNYGQWVQVRTDNFIKWFGDHVIAAAKPKRRAATFADARALAKEFQGKPLTNVASGITATVSRNNLDKMLSQKAVGKSEGAELQALAVANLDGLFENAIHGWSKQDRDGDTNIKAVHRFFAPLLVNGKAKLAKLTVKETVDANHANSLYTVEAVSFSEDSPAAQWADAAINADGIDPTSVRSAGLVQSLAQRVQDFNPEQVSKVTDPDTGEPMVVYHGTVSDFTEFSGEHLGKTTQATSANAGHFFSSSPRTGQSYADHGAIVSPVQELITKADEESEKGNWDAYDALIAQAEELDQSLSSPDARLRGQNIMPVFLSIKDPISTDAQGENPDGIGGITPLIDRALAGNNDGVVIRNFDDSAGLSGDISDHFAVFSPTQIKSATGNSGAFDGSNPDIRYSRQPASVRQARAFEQSAPISRQNLRGIKDVAMRQIDQVMSHQGTVSLWDKTVGTMRHLGEREPAFKPVFDAAQRFIDDVAMLASEVADAAPRLLPKIETVGDIFGRNRKKPISAADNKAVAKPLAMTA